MAFRTSIHGGLFSFVGRSDDPAIDALAEVEPPPSWFVCWGAILLSCRWRPATSDEQARAALRLRPRWMSRVAALTDLARWLAHAGQRTSRKWEPGQKWPGFFGGFSVSFDLRLRKRWRSLSFDKNLHD